jgi:hypothetical protein
MTEALLIAAIVLLAVVIVMLTVVLKRSSASTDITPILIQLDTLEINHDEAEKKVLEAVEKAQQTVEKQGEGLRPGIQAALKETTESLMQSVDWVGQTQQRRLEDFSMALSSLKEVATMQAGQSRTELRAALQTAMESFAQGLDRLGRAQQERIDVLTHALESSSQTVPQRLQDFAVALATLRQADENNATQFRADLQAAVKTLSDGMAYLTERANAVPWQQPLEGLTKDFEAARQWSESNANQLRTELSGALQNLREVLQRQMSEIAGAHKEQLDALAGQVGNPVEKSREHLEGVRERIEGKMHASHSDHAAKLEQLPAVLEERLKSTVERRLEESARAFDDRLEQFQRSLGEKLDELAGAVTKKIDEIETVFNEMENLQPTSSQQAPEEIQAAAETTNLLADVPAPKQQYHHHHEETGGS